jgi:hypothetical protein
VDEDSEMTEEKEVKVVLSGYEGGLDVKTAEVGQVWILSGAKWRVVEVDREHGQIKLEKV